MVDPVFTDIDRLLSPNARGDIKITENAETLEQALINLILTRKGEAWMRPEKGSNLKAMLQELADEVTKAEIASQIRDVFDQDPRFDLVNFDVQYDEAERKATVFVLWTSPLLIENQITTIEVLVNK